MERREGTFGTATLGHNSDLHTALGACMQPSDRIRDILPLPVLAPGADSLDRWQGLSRGSRQRQGKRLWQQQLVGESIRALNWLGGVPDGAGPPMEAQRRCLQTIEAEVPRDAPPADYSEHEALRALLLCDARYQKW